MNLPSRIPLTNCYSYTGSLQGSLPGRQHPHATPTAAETAVQEYTLKFHPLSNALTTLHILGPLAQKYDKQTARSCQIHLKAHPLTCRPHTPKQWHQLPAPAQKHTSHTSRQHPPAPKHKHTHQTRGGGAASHAMLKSSLACTPAVQPPGSMLSQASTHATSPPATRTGPNVSATAWWGTACMATAHD